MSPAADGEVLVVDADGRPLGVLTSTALAERLTCGDGQNGERPASTVGWFAARAVLDHLRRRDPAAAR